jgi:signal transduction histidine kinase
LAATVMAGFVHRSLIRGIDQTAQLRARDVAALVEADRLPTTVPSSGEQASVVQVVDPRGNVVSASGNIQGEAAIAKSEPAAGTMRTTTVRNLPIGTATERFRVSELGVATARGTYVVYVADSLDSVDATITSIWLALAVGLPALLTVVATVTWASTGRTLHPVEAIRRRVALIGGTDLAARVPRPPGHDEIARLADTMNEMLDRLEAASTAQRRFVADAAHELRGPLATIRAEADVALAHPEATDWFQMFGKLSTETQRLSDLVDDLLLLARADERGLPKGADDVDLDELVLAEAARLRAAGSKKAAVTIRDPARVRGSALRLERVLRNLGDNAARHARSRIDLELSVRRHTAVVTVADDGPGIATRDRSRVFDRFARLDAARDRRSGGTGLGLAITREIARAHGGDVAIDDPPAGERGAVLTVTLPLAESRPERAQSQETAQLLSAQPQRTAASVGPVSATEAVATRLRGRRRR